MHSAAVCCNDAPTPCTSADLIYAQSVPKAGRKRELSSSWKLLESYRRRMQAVFDTKLGTEPDDSEGPLDAAVLEALESAGCARTWSAPSVPPRRNGYNRRRGDAWASGHHVARNLVHT